MPCSPGMAWCRAECLHRALVQGYRDERERQVAEAENCWRERDGRESDYPLITFKRWLIANRIPDEYREEVS
jgi:hypothetical protein